MKKTLVLNSQRIDENENNLLDRVISYLYEKIELENYLLENKSDEIYDFEMTQIVMDEISEGLEIMDELEDLKNLLYSEPVDDPSINNKPKQIDLVDGVKMNNDHPSSFYIPSKDDKDLLNIGRLVKVSNGKERFWVEIESFISDDLMVGKIKNILLFGNYNYNNRIYFEKNHVIEISNN
jgi:hypothetical protein